VGGKAPWVGVYGEATANKGKTYGIYGRAATSSDGAGVYGISNSGIGVHGVAEAVGGWGVWGQGGEYGVVGVSEGGSGVVGSSGGSGIGVEGVTYGDGQAAYFHGAKAAAANFDAHIVGIRNAGEGSAGPDVLALEVSQVSNPDSSTNFITFLDSNGPVGAVEGNGSGGVVYKSGGGDFAESLAAAEGLEPGDVLVVAADGRLTRSTQPYQGSVVGVYSTAPTVLGSARKDESGKKFGKVPLAIMGVVPVKASTENGPIHPGDLLTTSSTPGHAMRCQGVEQCFGRVIGKALEGLDEGSGVINMLVMLQ